MELEAFIFFGDIGRVLFESCKLGFEIFDMTLFAFAEGSLAEEKWVLVC